MYLNNVKQSILREYAWPFVIAGSFLISVLVYVMASFGQEKIILYFPDSVSNELVGEYRIVPREGNRIERLRQYVEEAILGPYEITSYNIFLRETSVRSIFFQDRKTLIIDLDRKAMSGVPNRSLDLRSSLSILEKGLRANFFLPSEIRFLLDGQEIFIPPYVPAETAEVNEANNP